MGLVDNLKPLASLRDDNDAEGQVLKSLIDPQLSDMTTEIADPHSMSVLEMVGNLLRDESLPKSSAIIAEFVRTEKRNMVPYKRKRAEEIIRGVGASRKAKRTFTEKLVGKNMDVDD